jgi:hypothetical protein
LFVILHRRGISTTSDPSGLRVVIPYWFGWLVLTFVCFWTLLNIRFGYSEWLAISTGIVGPKSFDRLHVSELFSVFGFCVGVCLAAGREVVAMNDEHLQVRREILGVGWSKNYALAEVKDIRAGCFLDPKAGGKWNPDHVRAGLYFDYRGKVHSFGHELEMQDATRIEKLIAESFPDVVLHRVQDSTARSTPD